MQVYSFLQTAYLVCFLQVNKIDTFFDPTGWCADMASCSYSGIKKVYGHEALTKMYGCEFHYNQNVQRELKQLKEP